MEELFLDLVFLIICALAVIIAVRGQNLSQFGFISLDCGLPAGESYTEPLTGVKYISDAPFRDRGVNMSTDPAYWRIAEELKTVRSFSEEGRSCYNIGVTKGTAYTIRVTFMYGNYDKQNRIPEFDIHTGPNKWDSVILTKPGDIGAKDVIYFATRNYIDVCLVDTGYGSPFITALELRPLKDVPYNTKFGPLKAYMRIDFGSDSYEVVTFPEDPLDRLWIRDHDPDHNWQMINTTEAIDSRGYEAFQPPLSIMQTAATPKNGDDQLEIKIEHYDVTTKFYVFMYFAELLVKDANILREFNVMMNGQHWFGPFTPRYLRTTIVSPPMLLTGQNKYTFLLEKTKNANLPPLINAIEIYSIVEQPDLQTCREDVDAMKRIKLRYGIKKNWQGDPCSPLEYRWVGLNCSNNDHDEPRVISLNLSTLDLVGEITQYIANLSSLQELDLSGNGLIGSVPDFLCDMPNLKYLNLAENDLSGLIPHQLLEKSQKNSLVLIVNGNLNLCASYSCNNEKKIVIKSVVITAISVAILLEAFAISLWIILRRKKHDKELSVKQEDAKMCKIHAPIQSKTQHFTYDEILKITNNFERILGKGGSGTVYHGYLDGNQVAVKMLCASSIEGCYQFEAEVDLLLKVHHANLIALIGYCNESDRKVLIYEFMANGNLKEHLSVCTSNADNHRNILSWEGRLRIALEAAQGLDYLHSGCKPLVVHRDVKTTNILLNDKFQAKVADFGLSICFPIEDDTDHVSTAVAGTFGYLDPEYFRSERLTTKSDVYSFGVVLLELITSKPVVAKNAERTHISHWVNSMLVKGEIKDIVDPRLCGDFDMESMEKAVEIGIACTSTTSTARPTMFQVVTGLHECLAIELAQRKAGDSSESYSPNLVTQSTFMGR